MIKASLFVALVLLVEAVIFTAGQYPDQTVVQLYTCATGDRQRWQYVSSDKTIRLVADSSKCLDISNYGTTDGSIVWLYDCHTGDKDPSHQNQEWVMNADNTITSTLSGKCLAANGRYMGAQIEIDSCSNQKWYFNTTSSALVYTASGMCMDAGSPLPAPCEMPSNRDLPFCNTKLSFQARVSDLVSRIPLTEKIGLFGNSASGIPTLQIPAYQWWSEALHGVAFSPGVSFGGDVPAATSFPQIVGVSAAFDDQLIAQMSHAISDEARGMHAAGHAGLTFWAPNLNLIRDPRWGRGQETPGEDPYKTSRYVANFVPGLQGDDEKYLKVSSCCKHYAGYDLENWHGMDRYHFNAIITEQDMQDTYLPAFKSCVTTGKASSIMCSYNAVNGIPSCANTELLTTYARQKWGFDGYITGDCGAVDCVQNTHHYTSTPDQTCKVVLEAGTDIDCGGFLPGNLLKAVQDGAVSQASVDTALTHLFMVQMRLGIFDPLNIQPYSNLNASNVNTPAHQALALQAALESLVLLKNDNKALPLSKSSVKSIALIGPNAQATDTMKGNYYGQSPYLISPQAGLRKYTTVNFEKGCDIASGDKSGFEGACNAAKTSDATVMVMGLDQSQESEGHDRDIISLPGVQNDLITAVAQCSKGPLIVVVMAGGSVDLTVPKTNSKVGSILWVGYPGQSGGDAIAKAIFGDYNPAGRAPYTFYPADFVNQVSMEDMNMRPNTTNGNPGHTYRFYTGTPVYEFGDGLTYTTWRIDLKANKKIAVEKKLIDNNLLDDVYTPMSAPVLGSTTLTVTNTGSVTSDFVALSFVLPPYPGKNGAPLKSLNGYERLMSVKPGETRTVNFGFTSHDLSLVNENAKRESMAGDWKLSIEGTETIITVY